MTKKQIKRTEEYIKKYQVKEAIIKFQIDFDNQTPEFREYWHNLEPDSLSQAIGYFQESSLRTRLNHINIKNRCGNPKELNEDDIIIEDNIEDSVESKAGKRKYTDKRHQIKTVYWYTGRNGSGDRKINFICTEFEYIKNEDDFMKDKLIFHKIYVSYQMISYNDIKSNLFSENLIKESSILITL